jgi:hypothetical protein
MNNTRFYTDILYQVRVRGSYDLVMRCELYLLHTYVTKEMIHSSSAGGSQIFACAFSWALLAMILLVPFSRLSL